jgi:hypothetical protein
MHPVQPGINIPNPIGGIGDFIGGHIVDAVGKLIAALAGDFLHRLAAPVATFVLHTPAVTAEPTLRHLWLICLGVLVACLGLLIAIAGTAMIPGPTSRFARAAREALGARMLPSLLTAGVALPMVGLEVGLANRIVGVIIPEGFATGDNPLWSTLSKAVHGDAGAGLGLLVTSAIAVVLLVVLVVLALARWATIWLLIALAPIAMGFSMTPGGAGVARGWWRLQLAAVFLPIGNAVLLSAYAAMFTSPKHALVGALSGIAVLALMSKLPAWAAGIALGIEADHLAHLSSARRRLGRRAITTGAAVLSGGGSTAARGAAAAGTAAGASGSTRSATRPTAGGGTGGGARSPAPPSADRRD